MYEQKYGCVWAVLSESCHAVAIILEVLGHFARLHIKNIYHDADLFEDSAPLCSEIRVHERVLTSAIPEIQNEVAQKADVILLNIDSSAQASGQRCGVIGAILASVGWSLASSGLKTHKIRERIDVFPLPEAPMSNTCEPTLFSTAGI